MLTIYLDLVNHKLLCKLMIYENIWIKDSVTIQLVFQFPQYWTRSVGIPDMSGIHRTETLSFCPWPYRTRPIVIPDTSDRCRIETNNPLLVILCFSSIIYCIPTSQQMNCSTREPLKASYGKIKYFSIESNQPLSIFHK